MSLLTDTEQRKRHDRALVGREVRLSSIYKWFIRNWSVISTSVNSKFRWLTEKGPNLQRDGTTVQNAKGW